MGGEVILIKKLQICLILIIVVLSQHMLIVDGAEDIPIDMMNRKNRLASSTKECIKSNRIKITDDIGMVGAQINSSLDRANDFAKKHREMGLYNQKSSRVNWIVIMGIIIFIIMILSILAMAFIKNKQSKSNLNNNQAVNQGKGSFYRDSTNNQTKNHEYYQTNQKNN